MKKLYFTILLSLCFVAVNAQVESEFEKFKREQQEQMKAMMQSDSALYKELEKEYQDYVKAEKEAYEKFVKEISAMWGGDNVVESTNKEWVEYSDDGQSRSVVDFEQGEAKIEIIITPEEESSEVKLEAKVEEKVKDLIVNKGKTKDYDSSKEKAVPLQETPVLENQVQTPSGEVITENNVNEGVKEIVQEAVIEKKEITGDDGEKRQVVTIKLDLAPNHIKTRAEVYKNEVEKYCLKYDVDPALAYAVMQTESSFNPKAKSHVPAYGLMQIVPSSAGQDCAASLKKDFVKPTANYLYEPENNIEMGVHYLHLLKKRYYTKVTDPRSRDLCVIASYNTGAGNVARALRGDTKISKAIPQINEMSYDELFKYFEKKLLPETQNYIRKVTERMNDFNKWMK
jgi:membrane-bound lytic murein transglycosylase C